MTISDSFYRQSMAPPATMGTVHAIIIDSQARAATHVADITVQARELEHNLSPTARCLSYSGVNRCESK